MPNFEAVEASSGRRQGVREGVRPPAEGFYAEPRALSDEAHQPEQAARARSRIRAHSSNEALDLVADRLRSIFATAPPNFVVF